MVGSLEETGDPCHLGTKLQDSESSVMIQEQSCCFWTVGLRI